MLEVPASQNGYHSSTSPLPPHSPLSPGGPLAASVSPNPSAHHNTHLNNHLHPSHHQQTQAGVRISLSVVHIPENEVGLIDHERYL